MALLRPFSGWTSGYGDGGHPDSIVRRFRRQARRGIAALCAPLIAGSQFLVPVAVGAGIAAGLVVAHPVPVRASSGSVLILSTSVNGGSSSPEAQAVPSGYTVTVAPPSTWDAMTTAQFAGYSAIIIGDPSSSGTCPSSAPADALSTASTWGPAGALWPSHPLEDQPTQTAPNQISGT